MRQFNRADPRYGIIILLYTNWQIKTEIKRIKHFCFSWFFPGNWLFSPKWFTSFTFNEFFLFVMFKMSHYWPFYSLGLLLSGVELCEMLFCLQCPVTVTVFRTDCINPPLWVGRRVFWDYFVYCSYLLSLAAIMRVL